MYLYFRKRRRLRIARERKVVDLKAVRQNPVTMSIIEEKNRQLLSKMEEREQPVLQLYRKHSLTLTTKEVPPSHQEQAASFINKESRYLSHHQSRTDNRVTMAQPYIGRGRSQSVTIPNKSPSSWQPTMSLSNTKDMHTSVPLSLPEATMLARVPSEPTPTAQSVHDNHDNEYMQPTIIRTLV